MCHSSQYRVGRNGFTLRNPGSAPSTFDVTIDTTVPTTAAAVESVSVDRNTPMHTTVSIVSATYPPPNMRRQNISIAATGTGSGKRKLRSMINASFHPNAIVPAASPASKDHEHGDDREHVRHEDLAEDQPSARHRPHQQVAQRPPRGLTRNALAPERGDDHHQEELAHEEQRDDGEIEPARGEQREDVELPALPRRVDVGGDREDDRDGRETGQARPRAHATGLAYPLDPNHASSATIER